MSTRFDTNDERAAITSGVTLHSFDINALRAVLEAMGAGPAAANHLAGLATERSGALSC